MLEAEVPRRSLLKSILAMPLLAIFGFTLPRAPKREPVRTWDTLGTVLRSRETLLGTVDWVTDSHAWVTLADGGRTLEGDRQLLAKTWVMEKLEPGEAVLVYRDWPTDACFYVVAIDYSGHNRPLV